MRCFPIAPEFAVLTMLLILLVVGFSLAILLAAGTLFIQGYLYSEPVGAIFWRAPAAAGALTAFLGFWCFVNYRAADPNATQLPYETLFTSVGPEDTGKIEPALWVDRAGVRTHYRVYKYEGTPLTFEYRAEGKTLKPEDKCIGAIIVKEGDPKEPHEMRFVPQYGAGKYVEEGGMRYMTMDKNLGRIYTPRPGRSTAMVLLNLIHFGVWFAVVWLLLRFQWPHALGLAAVFWLAMTWLVVPQILAKLPRKPVEPTVSFSRDAAAERVGALMRPRTPLPRRS